MLTFSAENFSAYFGKAGKTTQYFIGLYFMVVSRYVCLPSHTRRGFLPLPLSFHSWYCGEGVVECTWKTGCPSGWANEQTGEKCSKRDKNGRGVKAWNVGEKNPVNFPCQQCFNSKSVNKNRNGTNIWYKQCNKNSKVGPL